MLHRCAGIVQPHGHASPAIDSLIFAGVGPALDPLRSDPRFDGVLKRVGWPLQ